MSRRGRSVLLIIGLVAVVLVLSLRGLAIGFTDYLWFSSRGLAAVWQRQWGIQLVLGLVFGAAFYLVLQVNQLIADRLAPPITPLAGPDDLMARYRDIVAPRQALVRRLMSLGIAIIAGLGASGQWEQWVLFRRGSDVGIHEKLNGVDVGFYLFSLPFISFVISWIFAALLIVILVSFAWHYLNGAIRLPGANGVGSVGAKSHLSILLAILAIVKAADYWLGRYRMTLSQRGVVDGALYTDVTVSRPVVTLMVLVAIAGAAAFIVNIRRRGWGLPVVVAALWMIVALVAGIIYPAGVQRLKVEAKESALERPFIQRNIDATRAAYGLDNVVEENFDYQAVIKDADVTKSASTVSNIRLLDPNLVEPTFTTTQAKVDYFRFGSIDTDRYPSSGTQGASGQQANSQVVVSVRELNPSTIPLNTWEGQHLAYTHGYGAAVAKVSAVTSDGLPSFALGDVPWRVDKKQLPNVDLERPEVYFGEGFDGTADTGYAIVGTNLNEKGVDTAGGSAVGAQYSGSGGVPIGSFVRRAAFALRFGDIETLVSGYLKPSSRVLFVRGVRDRVAKLAPFISWDSDPYPILVSGRIKYVVDGYTTSANYPYSQTYSGADLPAGSGLEGKQFNYIRNSVKAVVDAYDGSATLYVTDTLNGGTRDPIIHAYRAEFPELFTDGEDISDEIRSHLRYPEDLFRVQTSMWGRYHLKDAGDFYRKDDEWDVAQSPPNAIDRTTAEAASTKPATSTSLTTPQAVIAPYFLEMQLPGEDASEFVIFRPFVPHTEDSSSPKKQLNAFMVGRSDPKNYGRLVTYTMTEKGASGKEQRNRDVDGPLTIHDKMATDTSSRLSERLTQLNGAGGNSVVKLGNMLIVPIGQGLLYVRPIYVAGENKGSSLQLRIVVLAMGDRVVIGDTLAEALGKLFPTAKVTTGEQGAVKQDEPPANTTPRSGSNGGTATAGSLIEQATALFDEADKALRTDGAKGLAEYQKKTAEAAALVREAEAILGAGASPAASSTTTTTAKR